MAIKRGTGARGLRSIIEELLLNTMFDLPSLNDVVEVVIDKAVVENKRAPLMMYKSEIKSKKAS